MIFVVALLVGFAFGAIDQYIGTLHVTLRVGFWTHAVSQMSALWLLLPFLLGSMQERVRRGALVGLLATFAALFGYFLMGYSPFEGHPFSDAIPGLSGWARSNAPWVAGGLMSGPVFGALGARWRSRRSLVAAAIMAGVLLAEPPLRAVAGQLSGPAWVWSVEFAAGVVLLVVFARQRRLDPAGGLASAD